METHYDHKQFAILYVDDEELSLKNFARAFSDEFRIFTANNAKDGLKLIADKQAEIGILMTDQKMPGEKGTWLLERARELAPRIIRV
ncbi:MAG: response regulator, partial [Verrucomicrobia bacterium]|nr:response regulator [Verrucomicrobiota bacterium]